MYNRMEIVERTWADEDGEAVLRVAQDGGEGKNDGIGCKGAEFERFLSKDSERGVVMGVAGLVLGLIERVKRSERPKDVVAEQEKDQFLDRSLEIDEELRTGKSRMLSAEETRRYFEKVNRESR